MSRPRRPDSSGPIGPTGRSAGLQTTRTGAPIPRPRPRHGALALLSALGALGALASIGCSKDREADADPSPTYARDVAPIFAVRCASCHEAREGKEPAAGFRPTTYLGAIACVASSGEPATLSGKTGTAPILRALGDETHRGVVTEGERSVIARWVAAGAPAFRESVHAPSIVDPRSPGFHGAELRAARWAPMLDPDDPRACGRCHDGTRSRPASVKLSAPGATACTTCHAEPAGVLACTTCHGDGARAYPPRDPCFFPGDAPRAGAHAAHVEKTTLKAAYPCTTCHTMPDVANVLSGNHGNGTVDVIFDPQIVGAGATWDPTTGTCAVACHLHGGAREKPAWADTQGPMGCNGCHGAPPAAHYPGACTTCHREADATGTALTPGPMHMNGHVDLGDGSQTCAACHGKGGEPWPSGHGHDAHRNPTLTTPIDCASCHVVPTKVTDPGHMSGSVDVVFGGRAKDRGAEPIWTGTSCAEVACHGAKIPLPPVPSVIPVWADTSGAARACTACHGAPPQQHTPSASCERSDCHGGEVARSGLDLWITPAGRALHVNGVLDLAK